MAGGKAGTPTEVDRDRGAQWRLVMAFAGFEMVARALLHRGMGGFGDDDPPLPTSLKIAISRSQKRC